MGLAAKIVAVGCASLVLVGCIGFGIASAGSTPNTTSFGLSSYGENAAANDSASSSASATDFDSSVAVNDSLNTSGPASAASLTTTASRDVSQGVEAIAAEEEAARIAAEEAARAEEQARIQAAETARANQSDSAAASLPDIDWNVGKDAFIAEWSSRIDAYLSGSPLSGQGVTFATAAWNNGVDPRWSPAISNTESTKGAHCFLPHNAWGWGASSWGSWEEAINAHVAGLAEVYGYTISYANAMKYCPPNYDNWFRDTLSEMGRI